MGYTKSALSGFGWNTALKIATAGVTVVKLSILARLLTPEDFGVFSLIAIALGITEALTETGINITILQSKHSIQYYLNTAWVIAIIRGLLIGSAMVLLGLWMGGFYKEPLLPFLIGLAALVPTIKGCINPAIVLLQKNLFFFQDSAYRFSLVLTEAVLSVLLALQIKEVSALVFSLIGTACFEVAISFLFFRERPRFALVSNRAREILHNAKGLTLSAAFSYLYQNADDLLVGKLLGTYTLGLYHNSYALGHKANYEFAQASHHGTLPVFTKIVGDRPRLKRAFLRSSLTTMLLVSMLSLPLLLAPKLLVQLILGDQWLPIVHAVPLMAVAGLLSSFSLLCYTVFLANKKYQYMNSHLLLSVVLMIGLLWVLARPWGLAGAGWALVLSRAIPLPILLWGLYKSFTYER